MRNHYLLSKITLLSLIKVCLLKDHNVERRNSNPSFDKSQNLWDLFLHRVFVSSQNYIILLGLLKNQSMFTAPAGVLWWWATGGAGGAGSLATM